MLCIFEEKKVIVKVLVFFLNTDLSSASLGLTVMLENTSRLI